MMGLEVSYTAAFGAIEEVRDITITESENIPRD